MSGKARTTPKPRIVKTSEETFQKLMEADKTGAKLKQHIRWLESKLEEHRERLTEGNVRALTNAVEAMLRIAKPYEEMHRRDVPEDEEGLKKYKEARAEMRGRMFEEMKQIVWHGQLAIDAVWGPKLKPTPRPLSPVEEELADYEDARA